MRSRIKKRSVGETREIYEGKEEEKNMEVGKGCVEKMKKRKKK